MAPLLLLLLFSTTTAQSPTPDPFDLGERKTTHLRFFFHDIRSGRNATAIPIVNAPNTTFANGQRFGEVTMMDNLLTEGLNRSSSPVGRAQGFYAIASKPGEEFALLITMNLVFTSGKFNGSSLAVVGRNNIFSGVREMPVVGGSGSFRMARGYALLRTRWFDASGDASVEYDVYVTHFSGRGSGSAAVGAPVGVVGHGPDSSSSSPTPSAAACGGARKVKGVAAIVGFLSVTLFV